MGIHKQDYADYIEHYRADAEYNDYFAYDAFENESNKRRFQCLLSFLPGGSKPVLEIGSGGGEAAKFLRRRKRAYIPLDIPLVNLSRIRLKEGKQVHPVCGDAFHLPFRKGGIQAIILSEVLEHLPRPLQALEQVKGVLSRDGRCVISVPYKERISYQICVHCNKPTPTHAHFHSFDEKALKNLITDSGLQLTHLFTIGNKPANRVHLYRFMSGVPYKPWRMLDRLLNTLIRLPSHLVAVVKT